MIHLYKIKSDNRNIELSSNIIVFVDLIAGKIKENGPYLFLFTFSLYI